MYSPTHSHRQGRLVVQRDLMLTPCPGTLGVGVQHLQREWSSLRFPHLSVAVGNMDHLTSATDALHTVEPTMNVERLVTLVQYNSKTQAAAVCTTNRNCKRNQKAHKQKQSLRTHIRKPRKLR